MSSGPDQAFWQQRFEARATPWDRGEVNPALALALADGLLGGLARPDAAGQRPCIVVPGCGSGYELPALAQAGFDVVGVDYAPAAIERARALVETLAPALRARVTLAQADVLQWMPSRPVDAVWEQTCLCALHPDHWVAYASRLAQWLAPGALLMALFAQVPREGSREGRIEGPPYHCDVNAMRALFTSARWDWPRPPYRRNPHPLGMSELVVELRRR